jgi:hypothetical protein
LSSVIKVDKIQSDTGTVNVASKIEFPAGTVSAPSIFPTGDTNTGIFFPAADTIAFAEGGAEAMRIDSSGNVGIGTSSPDYKTEIEGTGEVRLNIHSTSTTGAGRTAALRLQQDNTGGNDGAGKIEFTYGTTPTQAAAIQAISNPNYLAFYTSTTERMRIDSSGYFKATSTGSYSDLARPFHEFRTAAADDWILRLSSTNASPYGLNIQFTGGSPNNNSNDFIGCSDSTTTRFQVRSNGGIANFSGNNVNLSDRREKINFAPAKNYLETICAIPVQTFNYIDQNQEDDPGLTLGVVAQDVQEVAPEFVMESNWGTQEEPKMRLSIYQTDLQYALMKCIQELKAELDEAKARIAALEAQE